MNIEQREREHRNFMALELEPFILRGSHGELAVDFNTGQGLWSTRCDCEDCNGKGYSGIAFVDMAELRKWAACSDDEALLRHMECDVLMVGYWNAEGRYEPPEFDFRARRWTDRERYFMQLFGVHMEVA